jgi:hypothetical protein
VLFVCGVSAIVIAPVMAQDHWDAGIHDICVDTHGLTVSPLFVRLFVCLCVVAYVCIVCVCMCVCVCVWVRIRCVWGPGQV